jgi:molybdate transport system ATP-binding protein
MSDAADATAPSEFSELVVSFEKRFTGGATVAADLRQPATNFATTVLFGPSGCGKTTVLRCLAGLERPNTGTIRFADETWFDANSRTFAPPQRRDIGFLFQDYALFPHLTVAENIGYGLRRLPTTERRSRVAALLDSFELTGLDGRLPHELSGGQQQRVALARTMARRPRLLLLDEPLSALDAVLREELRGRLRQRLQEFGVPTIIVTHDRTEAIALGDRIVVMDAGRVRQSGSVEAIFSRPVDKETARIVGIETVVAGTVERTVDGLAEVRIGTATVWSVAPPANIKHVYACFKGEDVAVQRATSTGTSVRNQLQAVIRSLTPEGALVRLGLDCGFDLTALVTRPACHELSLKVGDHVAALIKAPAIHLIPRD